ncbi:peroxisome biogenesis protein 22-like [Asparagus officinalis]|uniref:peroxisome biogenesis protein 22-like n=1 Tax=Asparagus officinalis TaxID=4686 RepID=UPI00098E688D|nr:peroxisome biogenesis protein 22-like [Asparagus officinalis]
MSDRVTDQIGTIVRRISQTLNRKVSEIVVLLFNHKHSGTFGALAGFAIAVIFTWRFMKPAPARPRRNRPKRGGDEGNGVGLSSQDCSLESNLKDLDVVKSSIELNLRQIVRRKLNGGRKMTCQLLGVILEERSPEELQKQAIVKPSVLEVLQEISKICDESEERVLLALDGAGLFATGALTKDRVLFCSTDMGRSSFVRQLEPDWHVDSNLEIVSQLARFIRHQLHISELELGQIASNVFTSRSLEQYFTSL